jgi:hypothetical protein
MSIYTENGYSSREEYLNLLREDYGANLVNTFVSLYNPSEDFGGLIRDITDAYYGEEDEEDEEEEDDWRIED